ncbi:MAG: CPBP family intramembrane metalloprotease [Gemmatimonadetes bacterium]|nr:CPBP family intramembrane metalloprotease [Gemmatimonadota bacterium]
MRRIPAPWLLLVVLGLAGLFTALRLLPEALDLTRDDIAMDRAAAVQAAERLADREGWRPAGDERRFAATYGEENPGARSFVELEQGGSEAFLALVDSGAYVPSRWTVRMFAPDSIAEVWVKFTPEGSPLGFGRTLSDDDPGTGNLDGAAAERLARATASAWDVDLARFELVESSSEQAPSGRRDHTVVFRRLGVELGEGEIRLAVRIAGSEPAGVYHSLEVPESFALRYQDLRTGNDGIALAASALFLVLFVIVGGGGGILFLARRRVLEVRPAFVLGGVVGLGLALTTINGLPLAWMSYDTAVPPRLFVTQTVGGGLLIGVVAAGLLGVLFMAAESMTRAAFPRQLQQWRLWSADAARSDEVLRLTVLGYALAGLHLGYITLFSLGTSRLEGWWSPASNVIQPDLIATYQPWLLAVAINLFAATWEESVFRAIPLAGAALLGARFGRRGWWIGAAMVLQAVIFAAGHANYPQQPSYARVVELIAPALVWGFVYLRAGLFPTIVAHFLYNLYLTAIPLFQMSATGIWVDRAVILGVAAIPLLVVVRARVRHGATTEAVEGARNGAWGAPEGGTAPADADERRGEGPAAGRPPPDDAPVSQSPSIAPPALRLPFPGRITLPVGLVLLIVAWVLGDRAELPPATTTRAEAVEIATAEMRTRGFDPDPWDAAVEFTTEGGQSYQWVFDELGAEAYDRLLGTWLAAPHWHVRFADFDRGAEERVETFTVVVESDGRVSGFTHALPESRPGAALDEAEARALAEGHLSDVLGLNADDFDEIAAQQEALPARRDWTFGFRPRGLLPDSAGEARLRVAIAGDDVVSVRRDIDPPEAWVREQQREARVAIAMAVPVILLVLGAGSFLLVVAVRMWARGALPLRTVVVFAGIAFPLLTVTFANGIPAVAAGFDPVLGWPIQFWGWVFAGVLMATLGAGAIGFAAAVARVWLGTGAVGGRGPHASTGTRGGAIGLGVLAVAVAQMASVLMDAVFGEPARPGRSFEGIDHWLPTVSTSLGAVLGLVGAFAALAFLGAVYRRSAVSSRVRFAFQVGVGMVAATAAAMSWSESPLRALMGALAVGAAAYLYAWLVSRVPPSAIGAAFGLTLLGLLGAIVDPSYPGHASGGWIGLVLVGAATVWMTRMAPVLESPGASHEFG